jgi:catalase
MKKLTTAFGAPVDDNQNIATAGKRGPALLQNIWFIDEMAHFDREVIPQRRMHAKGSGAFGTFTVTHDITKYTKAKIFSEIGTKAEMFARFSAVAGERGAADAEQDIRGFAFKFYCASTEMNGARPTRRRVYRSRSSTINISSVRW